MMTLAEISTFVCARLNQSDATSVSLCKDFIKRRYELIYDQRNWRDATKNVAATLSDTATGLMDMPTGIARVIAIRSGGDHILYPVDSPMIMQIDPFAFERSSTPLAFEEFTDETQSPVVRRIRFIPIPNISTALLITGKRTLTNLSADGDSPILRNIDNTLIAFVTGDMLERARQYGKAQAKFQEAAALLQKMVESDTKDTGNMPRIIPVCEPDYATDDSWLYRT